MWTGNAILVLILRICLIICLYIFLGVIISSIKREITNEQSIRTMSGSVLELCSSSGQKFTALQKVGQIYVIGCEDKCDFSIAHESIAKSHAVLFFSQNRWWIENISSIHETWLNKKPLDKKTALRSGDMVRCGDISLTVKIDLRST